MSSSSIGTDNKEIPWYRWIRSNLLLLLALTALVAVATAWGITAATSSNAPSASPAGTKTMDEYVAGTWVPFTSTSPLNAEQWSIVNAYANFSTAAMDVYVDHSVAPLATVVSSQSHVTGMFSRYLAKGVNPEALYTRATVEQVSIHGCRARLSLELYYPRGRKLYYVSSWVRPFNRANFEHAHNQVYKLSGDQSGSVAGNQQATASLGQHAPWQFIGDNRVGGVDTPCGI